MESAIRYLRWERILHEDLLGETPAEVSEATCPTIYVHNDIDLTRQNSTFYRFLTRKDIHYTIEVLYY